VQPRRAVLALVGCLGLLLSPSLASAGDAKVSGKVTLDGEPLGKVRIFFHLADGQFVGATTSDDGTYLVSRVPEGTRKITVEGKGVPAKYASEKTASLSVEVKKGSLTFDVALAGK
jgi:hypothetical protein